MNRIYHGLRSNVDKKGSILRRFWNLSTFAQIRKLPRLDLLSKTDEISYPYISSLRNQYLTSFFSSSSTASPTATSVNTVDHESLIVKANERYAELKRNHLRLKTENIPENSFDPSESKGEVDADLIRRKRLLYRSKQRGRLEVDLLLGSWAAENVFSLSEEEMDEYEDILNQETIDIFNLVNKKIDPIPSHLDTKIMKRLQDYAYGKPFGSSSEDNLIETYTKKKEETKLI